MMANGKAPMIVNPYGGPGAQTVRDAWGGGSYYFDCILARQGFAVLHVDNRGMANRGKRLLPRCATTLARSNLPIRLRPPNRRYSNSPKSMAIVWAFGDGAMAATSPSIP